MIPREKFKQLLDGNPFDRQMDYRIFLLEPGHTELEMDLKPGIHDNYRKEVHGGALLSMTDTSMGTACYTLGKAVCTIDINANFFKPIRNDETLRIVSQVEHNGRRTMVVTTKIYNEKDDVAYMARGTFFVLHEFDPETFDGL